MGAAGPVSKDLGEANVNREDKPGTSAEPIKKYYFKCYSFNIIVRDTHVSTSFRKFLLCFVSGF